MPLAAYVFYRFNDADLARSWLGDMADPATTAAEWDEKPTRCVNVGLTYVGLEALGLPAPFLASFPEDFRQGMAARAASRLGDAGVDLPEHWEALPGRADAIAGSPRAKRHLRGLSQAAAARRRVPRLRAEQGRR